MLLRRPRPFIVLVLLVFVATTFSFGVWQWRRGDHKAAQAARQSEYDRQPAPDWQGALGEAQWQRRVVLHGRWYAAGQIFLDNHVYQGRAGYYVLAPLQLADGRMFPVFRGWMPKLATAPLAPLPAGEQTITVRLASPQQRYVELAPDGQGGVVWQNLDRARLQAQLPAPLVPALAYQLAPGVSDLVRDWPRQGVAAERHYIYAGQWFLFGLTAIALFVYSHRKRNTE